MEMAGDRRLARYRQVLERVRNTGRVRRCR